MMLARTVSPVVLYSLFLTAALVFILSLVHSAYISTQFKDSQQSLMGKYGGNTSQRFHDSIPHEHKALNTEFPLREDLLQPIRHDQKQPDGANGINCPPSNEGSASKAKGKPSETGNTYESLRQYAINNTVIIVPVNKGMLIFAENMICSLKKINFSPKEVVFWTLDEEVGRPLRSWGLNTFHDPSLFGVSEYVGFDYTSPQFGRMMTERPKFFINVLSVGLDLLFLDADIIFYDDPFTIVDQSVDLTIGSDSRDFFGPDKNPFQDPRGKGDFMPPVCAGTFWMKSNEKTITLFQIMILVFKDDPSVAYLRDKGFSDDQRGLDVLLNDGRANLVEPLPEGITMDMLDDKHSDKAELKVRILDQARVASGHLFLNEHDEYEEHLATLERKGGKKLAIHLNWNTVFKPKIEGAKEMNIWQLTDDGKCT